jgi:hypothetical protein
MIFARSNLINVFDRVLRAAMSLSAVAVIGLVLVVVMTSKLQESAILWAAWKQAVLEGEAQLCQVPQQLPKTKSSQIHRSLACADGGFVPKQSLIRSRDGAAQVARYMLIVPMSYREASPATNTAHCSTLALEPKAYWPAYSDQLRGESHRDDYRLVDDPAGKSCPSESLSKPSKRASKLPSQRAGILEGQSSPGKLRNVFDYNWTIADIAAWITVTPFLAVHARASEAIKAAIDAINLANVFIRGIQSHCAVSRKRL